MSGACQEADEERECAQSLGEGLADKHNFFLKITAKIKVVEDRSQDLRNDLYENKKSKVDSVEEATSLMASSKTLEEDYNISKVSDKCNKLWKKLIPPGRSYEIEVSKFS